MKNLSTKQAGRLVRVVVYTVSGRTDSRPVRAARRHITSEARQKINIRTSRDKLEMVLAANFDAGDLWITLTYDDDHLPPNRNEARKWLQRFIRKLRKVRTARGRPIKYVYCTQRILDDGSHRLHHHMILNACGPEDYEDILSLWDCGQDVYIKKLEDDFDLCDKATYMCHEPRDWGKPKAGEQMWTPSRGLLRPTSTTEPAPDTMTLIVPPGAVEVEHVEDRCEYGDWAYLKYWLPK